MLQGRQKPLKGTPPPFRLNSSSLLWFFFFTKHQTTATPLNLWPRAQHCRGHRHLFFCPLPAHFINNPWGRWSAPSTSHSATTALTLVSSLELGGGQHCNEHRAVVAGRIDRESTRYVPLVRLFNLLTKAQPPAVDNYACRSDPCAEWWFRRTFWTVRNNLSPDFASWTSHHAGMTLTEQANTGCCIWL